MQNTARWRSDWFCYINRSSWANTCLDLPVNKKWCDLDGRFCYLHKPLCLILITLESGIDVRQGIRALEKFLIRIYFNFTGLAIIFWFFSYIFFTKTTDYRVDDRNGSWDFKKNPHFMKLDDMIDGRFFDLFRINEL